MLDKTVAFIYLFLAALLSSEHSGAAHNLQTNPQGLWKILNVHMVGDTAVPNVALPSR